MAALWNWFNGNKMIFGLFLLFLAQNVPSDMLIWVIPLKALFDWVGGILTGVGAVHKLIKSNTQPGPNA
jgi:hypothetical protein